QPQFDDLIGPIRQVGFDGGEFNQGIPLPGLAKPSLPFAVGATLAYSAFHIADDGLPTVVHMDVLDADKLLTAVTQASKNLHLHRKGPKQTTRSRGVRRNSS